MYSSHAFLTIAQHQLPLQLFQTMNSKHSQTCIFFAIEHDEYDEMKRSVVDGGVKDGYE